MKWAEEIDRSGSGEMEGDKYPLSEYMGNLKKIIPLAAAGCRRGVGNPLGPRSPSCRALGDAASDKTMPSADLRGRIRLVSGGMIFMLRCDV